MSEMMNDQEKTEQNQEVRTPEEQKVIIRDKKGRVAGRFRTDSRRRAAISAFGALACGLGTIVDFWVVASFSDWKSKIWDPILLLVATVLLTLSAIHFYRKDASERRNHE